MKNYILLIFSALLFSCGGNEKHTDFSNLSIKIDTVMVDSKDEIIMGATNMFLSGFSNDNSTIYHYDANNGFIELINLNQLALEKKIKVEKEGPEGVGTVWWFDFWNDSLFVFYNFTRIEFLDQNMKKVSSIDLQNSYVGKTGLGKGYMYKNNFTVLDSPKRLLSQVTTKDSDFLHLAYLDFDSEKVEIIQNTDLEKVNDFNISLIQGKSKRSIVQSIGLLSWNNKTYIFNQANNQVFEYLNQENILQEIPIQQWKIPSQKSKSYRLETESQEEFKEQVLALDEEVTYNKLVVDPKSGDFYRIASIKTQASYECSPSKWDIYLIKYDSKFNLLAEVKILDNGKILELISEYFVKDGMVWIRVNLNDEMGFVRIKIG